MRKCLRCHLQLLAGMFALRAAVWLLARWAENQPERSAVKSPRPRPRPPRSPMRGRIDADPSA